MSITRKDLRQRLGSVGFIGDVLLQTCTTAAPGTTATLTDITLTQPDAFFQNADLLITSGLAIDDVRSVSTWVQSTHLFTPDRAFSANVKTPDTYELHRLFTVSQKNSAINNAIRAAKLRWPRMIVDESITQVSNQLTYALDSLSVPIDPTVGLDEVHYQEPGTVTGQIWPKFDPSAWSLSNNDGTLTLQLVDAPPSAGYKLRLLYRVAPSVLDNDTATLAPNDASFSDFIVTLAASYLCYQRSLEEREDTVKGPWIVKGATFEQAAYKLLTQDKPHKTPGHVIFGTWGNDPYEDENFRRLNAAVDRIRL